MNKLGEAPANGGLWTFTGQAANEWFGPGTPLTPVAQLAAQGRAYDFATGYNLQTRPKPYEGMTFQELRNLADGYDLLRLVIETRKDQVEKLAWDIKKRGQKIAKRGAAPDARIERIKNFLAYPDLEHPLGTWLRMLLEDVLVIDAPSVYVRRTRGGGIYALDPIDGGTIKRILDPTGRTPLEGPAYQQIIKGIVACEYTRAELLWGPRNPRTHRAFGFSPVEQVATTVGIALRRQLHQLSYYTDGSTPNLIFGVPKEWPIEAIKKFQDHWDSLLKGNTAQRAGTRFVPGDVKPIDTKDQALKDDYDEWLARIVCFAFSVSPTSLVKETNRATAQTVQKAALSEGLAPIMNWAKAWMDRILWECFEAPDLEFVWSDEQALDPLVQAQRDQIDSMSGVRSVDECREDRGLEGRREPAEGGAEDGAGAPGVGGEAVQDTAMNGAQVSSLIQIVEAAGSGTIPKETAQAIIQAAFPALGADRVNAIINPVKVKEKAEPAPVPALGAAQAPPAAPAAPKAAPAAPATPKAQPEPSLTEGKVAKAAKKIKPINRNRKLVVKLEAKLAKVVKGYLAAQVQPIAQALAEAMPADADKLAKMSPAERARLEAATSLDWSGLAGQVEPVLTAIAQDGAAQGLAQVGASIEDLLDQVNEQAVAWAEVHAADLVTRLAETTRDHLRGDLAASIELGMSTDQIAEVLEADYQFGEARAELIARTERAFADVRGNTLAYAASGVVGGLQWITANEGDGQVCEDCEMNDGATVPMDESGEAKEPFPSGALTAPAHPDCRCDVLPVLNPEEE